MNINEIRETLLDQLEQTTITRRSIAKQLDISEDYLRDILNGKSKFPLDILIKLCTMININLHVKMIRKKFKVSDSLIAEKYESGMSACEISEDLNIAASAVYMALDQRQIKRVRGRRRLAYQHPDFEQMKKEYLSGNTLRDLAKKYNVKQHHLIKMFSQNKVYKNKRENNEHASMSNSRNQIEKTP